MAALITEKTGNKTFMTGFSPRTSGKLTMRKEDFQSVSERKYLLFETE